MALATVHFNNAQQWHEQVLRILRTIIQIEEAQDPADAIHVCKEECLRIFKKQMNLTLFEFLLQYRIEKSIDYLIHTKYSINIIAESVGFNDSNYFTKVFRKQKGCSPTKYRQSKGTYETKKETV